MKGLIRRNTDTHEAALRWLDEISRSVGREDDAEYEAAVRRAFWHWALSSYRNLECLLFVDLLHRRLRHIRSVRSDLLHEFIPTKVPRNHSQEGTSQTQVAGPAYPEPEGSSVLEHITARIVGDLDGTTVQHPTQRSERALLRELARACQLGPADGSVFWNRIYKRRDHEDEPFRWFTEAASHHILAICAPFGAGKSTLIASYLRHLSAVRPARHEYLPRPDIFYIDVSLMREEVRTAYTQAVEYSGGVAGDPATKQEFEEILRARIEALLEGDLVSKIQRRLIGCFRATITKESPDKSALNQALGFGPFAGAPSVKDLPDSGARRHVAAVALIAARQKRRELSRKMLGLQPSPIRSGNELQAQLDSVLREIANHGAHDLNALLARLDISACDGPLWRHAYTMCFGRTQPIVIFDNLEAPDTDCAVRSTVRAALKIAANIVAMAFAEDRWWKTVLAVRDEAEVSSEASKLGIAQTAWIKLMAEPAVKAENRATWYVPLTPACRTDILEARISEALGAWAQRKQYAIASAAISRDVASEQTDRLSGVEFDSVSQWLTQTFAPVYNALYERVRRAQKWSWLSPNNFDLRHGYNNALELGILHARRLIVLAADHQVVPYLPPFASRIAKRFGSSQWIGHSLLMHESASYYVSDGFHTGHSEDAEIAQRLLIDASLYRDWENQHHRLMQQVCAEKSGMAQAVALRRLCLALIHHKTCARYLNRATLTGPDGKFSFKATDWNAERRIDEIQPYNHYVRVATSLLCARHIGLNLLQDGAVGRPLEKYEQAYAAYLGLFCTNIISTTGGRATNQSAALLPYIKRQLTELRGVILAIHLGAGSGEAQSMDETDDSPGAAHLKSYAHRADVLKSRGGR